MINVWLALLIVGIVGGLGGIGHGIFFTDAPLQAPKQVGTVMVQGTPDDITIRPNSILKQFGLGVTSGLLFYGSTLAPATVVGFHVQVQLVLGSLAGIGLIGLAGGSYLTSQIKERQWRKLDPAYDEQDNAFKSQFRRGIANPSQVLHALSIK